MFAHLHTHAEFSLLDGLSRIPQLMDRAVELGQQAIGLTDHGVLYGAVQFYKEAKVRGIKPIIGIEAYVAQGSRHSREPQDKQPYHLTLLAKNNAGYANLLALSTKSHLEGYYYKPRIDRELLEQHRDGLIALSGCATSEISRHLLDGRFDAAVDTARYYQQLFGGDYYIELQEHGITEHEPLSRGLARRYPGEANDARRRLDYELEVVRQTGFADYILVVHDFSQYARERGILMAVRGSAAASIILYVLGVTDINPLEHWLVFERFLNVERREMPDVDLDFAEDRRDEMIRYAAEKYGQDRVAQIITFGTLGAKASIRDVGRALGMSYADVDRVARLVPTMPASFGAMTIEKAFEESPDFKELYEADEQIAKLIDTARELEGVARHASTHAAGVVIAPEPLVNFLPPQRPSSGDPNSLPTTQFGMWDVAELGLLKMDFLGLTNLTILGTAVQVIEQVHGTTLDVSHLPDGDAKTYNMLARGETFGVFQLESGGMTRYVQELRPSSIKDLAAMVALYRPGPMQHIPTYIRAKHGLEAIHYPHPDLADILDETYGVIVYQDQVLLIAQKFAGYSLGQADVMRKAMGKKVRAMMRADEERFLNGAAAKGYVTEEAKQIYDLIEPFAGYAFNKAHAVSYGTIAYQTAYLKANYPAEYMTAVMMMAGGQQRVAEAYAECVRAGIPVQPPDVNHSAANFSLESAEGGKQRIRFGLASVKNVGEGVAEGIIEARSGRPFQAIHDVFER